MGVTYLQQRNLPAAMRELSQASELDPDNPEIDLSLGIAYMNRGEYRKAEEHLRNAIGKKRDYADAHNNLGIVLGLLGRGDESIREFEAAAKDVYYTTPETAWFNMGEEFRRQRKMDKAEEAYRKSIAANDRYASPHYGLAVVQGSLKRWDDAAAALERYVSLDPADPAGWMALGRAYEEAGKPSEAIRGYQGVLSGAADQAVRKQAADRINALRSGAR